MTTSSLTDNDLKQIEGLAAALKKILELICDMSGLESVYGHIEQAIRILEEKNPAELVKISSILYHAFSELDQGEVSDELDLLMHEAYIQTIGNKIFRNLEGTQKKTLNVVGEKRLIGFLRTDEGAWQPYEDKINFLSFISPMDGIVFKPWNTDVNILALPFYTDVFLVEVLHRLNEGGYYLRHFIKHKKGWVLDEKSGSLLDKIYKYQAPHVTLENLMDYMKFYQFFTYTDTGRGILLEGEESEFLDGLSAFYKSHYLEDFEKPAVKEIQHPKCFEIHFRSVSGDGMTDNIYHVYPDGGLEFVDLKFIGTVKPFPY